MNKAIIVVIIVTVVLTGGYLLLQLINQTPAPQLITQQSAAIQQTLNTSSEATVPQNQNEVKNEVMYSDSGYSPSTLTIKVGNTVTWKNESSYGMWTASAMHPSHTIYSGTSLQEHCPDTANISFDECKSAQPGESWSFTFNKKGTWPYHNHVKSSDFGKIIVK